jgi:hypothetical protein
MVESVVRRSVALERVSDSNSDLCDSKCDVIKFKKGTDEKYELMCEPSDLRIEPQPCLCLLLSNFKLAFFIFSDIRNPNLATEGIEDAILRCVDRRR